VDWSRFRSVDIRQSTPRRVRWIHLRASPFANHSPMPSRIRFSSSAWAFLSIKWRNLNCLLIKEVLNASKQLQEIKSYSYYSTWRRGAHSHGRRGPFLATPDLIHREYLIRHPHLSSSRTAQTQCRESTGFAPTSNACCSHSRLINRQI
jgi:hypothetical protein